MPQQSTVPAPHPRRLRAAVPVALVGAVLLLTSCGGGTDEAVEPGATSEVATSQPAPVAEVDGAQALALVDDGATLVDVRTPEEFAQGHVAGAVNIDLQSGSFADEVAALDPQATYVVYCVSGNRSGQATVLMQEQGLTRLHDAGAFDDLVAAGAEVTSG